MHKLKFSVFRDIVFLHIFKEKEENMRLKLTDSPRTVSLNENNSKLSQMGLLAYKGTGGMTRALRSVMSDHDGHKILLVTIRP